MQRTPIKVLYIGGWGRSGSTLLGNILGELPGWAHVGELAYVWELGGMSDKLCGCGKAFSRCAWWSRVFDIAFGGPSRELSHRMFALRNRLPKHRGLPIIATLPAASKNYRSQHREYLHHLATLYSAIHGAHDLDVIVDSSKAPWYALALAHLPNVELTMLHLIRDPRATSHAWNRRLLRTDVQAGQPEHMQRFSVNSSAIKWVVWNIALELLVQRFDLPSMQVRYEDFVASPRSTFTQVASTMGVRDIANSFTDACTATLGTHHTVWGNPSRMRQGAVHITPDERWRSQMSVSAQCRLALLTWPLLLKYGYSFGSHKRT